MITGVCQSWTSGQRPSSTTTAWVYRTASVWKPSNNIWKTSIGTKRTLRSIFQIGPARASKTCPSKRTAAIAVCSRAFSPSTFAGTEGSTSGRPICRIFAKKWSTKLSRLNFWPSNLHVPRVGGGSVTWHLARSEPAGLSPAAVANATPRGEVLAWCVCVSFFGARM